jgi:hypothetical protein
MRLRPLRVLQREEKNAVSLLNRLSPSRHLDDNALAEIWTAAVASGQPASHAHLSACATCRARYASFESWLDRMRDDARAEADEAFPQDRLVMQQAQVLRRLEALERPARVIAFPRFARPVTSTQGNAQRWVAAAAAAGLVIGLAAGQFVDIRRTFSPRTAQPQNTNARLESPREGSGATTAAAPGSSVSDEALFFGPDTTRNIVPISTLQPMDAITPLARDYDRPQ